MRTVIRRFTLGFAVFAFGLTGCTTTLENPVKSPRVELHDVQVVGLGFNSQTFLLSFSVSNPNSFALPVRFIRYAVKLDGHRFASGETPSDFTVPAGGDARFSISVDLNLLQTAPQLLSIVHQGVRENVSYELEGRLAIDIPLVPAVSYRNAGSIRLSSDSQ